MRLSLAFAAVLSCSAAMPAVAQVPTASPAAPPPVAAPKVTAPSVAAAPVAAPPVAAPPVAALAPSDPVVATVNGSVIRLSDVTEAAQTLPDEVRSMPPGVLFPMLLDQMVDRQALVLAARRDGLDRDPVVVRAMTRADDQVLQNALLSREIGPAATEAAVRAKYEATVVNKPGEEEVHAHHILVDSEAKAKAIIAALKKGGDFATIAKKESSDPAAQNGGDLGFFKKGDMVPEFAAAAFALKPGEVTPEPIKTQFGWHVIRLDERRTAPVPTFEQSRDELRQQVVQEGVRAAVAKARAGLKIEEFNMDGSPAATPAPAAAGPASDIPPLPGAASTPH